MDVRKSELIKQGTDIIGARTKVKIVKNKVAPPFKEAEFDIMYGTGISKIGCILDIATAAGIIQKGGAWYSYNEERIGQGRENAKQFLKERPELLAEIEEEVRDILFNEAGDAPEIDLSEE